MAATALTLMMLDTAGFGPIVEARRAVVSVGHPVGRLLAFTVRPVTTAWHGAVHYSDVEAENRELRRENAELAGRLAGQPDAQAELAALLEATDIGFLGDIERVTARVVADRRSDIERVLEIDKGRSDGIVEGMPVVTGHGLVGVVAVAATDRSVIRLVTDVEVNIGVRSRFGLGLATGTGPGSLRLEPSPELAAAIQSGRVTAGERFVTSGVDRSIYPAGIPVGSLALAFEDGAPAPAPFDVAAQQPQPPAGPSLTQDAQIPTETVVVQPPSADQRVAKAESDLRNRPVTITLEPFASLDRLGFVSVLLVEPTR